MKPVTGVVVGAVLIPLGLAISLTWLPASIADALAYNAAGACQEPIPNGSGCWTEMNAVETGTEAVRRGKSISHYVDLEDDFGTQRVEVRNTSAFQSLEPGQSVSVRFWKGSVVVIHVPGHGDLLSEGEPGTTAGFALLVVLGTILFGGIFFLGGLGVHRDQGSWTRSVSRDEFGKELFDAVAPPARRWVQALFTIGLAAVVGPLFAHGLFGAPVLPAVLVCAGLGALVWAWILRHRSRRQQASGISSPSRR